jgi:hypothetical protein
MKKKLTKEKIIEVLNGFIQRSKQRQIDLDKKIKEIEGISNMEFYETVCSVMTNDRVSCQISFKVEKIENDNLVPAIIKWEMDNLLTSSRASENILFATSDDAEKWILDECKKLWPNRQSFVKIYSLTD